MNHGIVVPYELCVYRDGDMPPKMFNRMFYENRRLPELTPAIREWCDANTDGWRTRWEPFQNEFITSPQCDMAVAWAKPMVAFKTLEDLVFFRLTWL